MNKYLLLLLAIAISGVSQSQLPKQKPVVRVGGIAGENGVFASLDGLITMYSDNTIRVLLGPAQKWQLIDHSDAVSFGVKDDHMTQTADKIPLASAHESALCDPLNQIDISSTVDRRIVSILPKSSKIKSVEVLSDRVTFAVYTEPVSPTHYSVKVMMVETTTPKSAREIGSDTVPSDGFYCGIQSLGGNLYTILLDEPSGSSNFTAAYVYSLRNPGTDGTIPLAAGPGLIP